jgi:imidazolonepropionase-like amidohydrolase
MFSYPFNDMLTSRPLLAGWLVLAGGFIVGLSRAAQPISTAPLEGLREASPRVHALVGARVVTAPDHVIENGTIVVRDGVIQAVGAGLTPPADARVWEAKGRTIYAGFIESESTLFLPASWKGGGATPGATDEDGTPATPAAPLAATSATPPAAESTGGTRSWNPRVTPERLASRVLQPDPRGAEALRKLGFAVAHVVPARGVFRGQSALVSLGRGGFNTTVIRESVAQPLAFETGSGGYPVSLMGATALLRQTLLDAQWYRDVQARYQEKHGAGLARPETNDALAALGPVIRGEQPVVFDLDDELDAGRAVRLAEEFKLKLVLRSSGYDYRTLRSLPKGVPMIVTLNFPEAPAIEQADHAADISLDKLEHWELAPTNPARLDAAGIAVALSTSGLRRPEADFWPRVRKAVQHGLPAGKALAALTTTPAGILGVERTHGTLAVGKVANLVVASGDLFSSDDAEVQLTFVDGEPFELDAWRRFDPRGTWRVAWAAGGRQSPAEIKITGRTATRVRASASGSDTAVRTDGETFTLLAPGKWFGLSEGVVRLAARADHGGLHGTGELPDGASLRWRAERSAPAPEANRPAEKKTPTFIARPDVYPAGAFGRTRLPPEQRHVFVRNATIWTSGPEGVIENGDLLIENGRVVRVGKSLMAPVGAQVIDASGKHVSPGLIDCHSHAALARGVNEGSHSVTVEVRVGDAIDPTDIALYWQLAGGLTTSNILHGSANAMGGQNQVIKLRWGESAEGLKFTGAPPGVKFALGENVTRKNATTAVTRYPVSRMGVREIMLDTFTRARDYEREWGEFRAGRGGLPPRRDLRLEAALEMLRGERLIHIHSYRQDEVLAFIRLAEQLKLSVATFQHILEGYKVGKEIAALGAGGSCFSDWWAYKHEVVDAIPHAGALMRAAGVVVSFNSDDKELARHLNTEAAKAVKYGGVPPVEALKFVTINPARQLRIDQRVGSLEPGKDADFVIWSAAPLSGYARAEQTWIDGRRYFDLGEDAQMRTTAATLRAALIQKIIPERQRTFATGGGSNPDNPAGGDEAARPPVLLVLQQLTAGHESGFQALYHDGGNAHNCTTHDLQ